MSSKTLRECLRRLDLIIYHSSRAAAGISILTMFLTVVVLVIARYVAQAPIFWGEELARYLMFYMIMMGSAVAIREDRHLRLRMVIDVFSPKMALWWERFLDLCLLIIAGVFFYQGLDMAIEDGIMTTPALRIAYFWVYLAFPIGAILMTIQLVAKQFNRIVSSEQSASEG